MLCLKNAASRFLRKAVFTLGALRPSSMPNLTRRRCAARIMDWYFVLLIALAAAAIAFVLGYTYRKKVGEREIGSAELEATRLIN